MLGSCFTHRPLEEGYEGKLRLAQMEKCSSRGSDLCEIIPRSWQERPAKSIVLRNSLVQRRDIRNIYFALASTLQTGSKDQASLIYVKTCYLQYETPFPRAQELHRAAQAKGTPYI